MQRSLPSLDQPPTASPLVSTEVSYTRCIARILLPHEVSSIFQIGKQILPVCRSVSVDFSIQPQTSLSSLDKWWLPRGQWIYPICLTFCLLACGLRRPHLPCLQPRSIIRPAVIPRIHKHTARLQSVRESQSPHTHTFNKLFMLVKLDNKYIYTTKRETGETNVACPNLKTE